MTTQQHIMFAQGEDCVETLTMFANDGVSTISIVGWSLSFVASLPGGVPVINLATGSGIVAGAPAACNATLTFAAALTASLSPGYFDFEIRRTDSGSDAETTNGTLVLTP